MEDRISDLNWIIYYAEQVRKALLNGHRPMTAEVERLAQLSQTVQREFDEEWNAWCDNLSCTE
jgi:hypothetical protein